MFIHLIRYLARAGGKPPRRADKLAKLLGEDAPRHIIDSLNAEQKPWYLRPSYSPTELMIDPDGSIRGGTMQALVERLTAHEHGGALRIHYHTLTLLTQIELQTPHSSKPSS